MCGIVVCHVPTGSPARHALAMAHTLRHRGPDGEGYLLGQAGQWWSVSGPDTTDEVRADPNAIPDGPIEPHLDRPVELAMAQRRLSIVDLSPAGHQPMRRGHRWLVYNGEVYNHVELRAELEALGHRFRSHSDTEVLLAAFEQWGDAALARLNGMWSLVLLDTERRELLIARDRFGVKPLYVWRQGGALLLASEVKALLAHPLVPARPDEAACQAFLRDGPDESTPGTLFAGIERFPAGHVARVRLDAPDWAPRRFWHWPAATDPRARFDADEAARLQQRYVELLDDAVRLRLRADVPVGTALSGGLDSSSVAWLVNRQLRGQGVSGHQQVFSSVWPDPSHRALDESAWIDQVAGALDVDSHRIEARWQHLPIEHERMVWALDTPPANTLMASWHTYRLVAERGVTVTLDGQGADEQLAGYVRYWRNHLMRSSWPQALADAREARRQMPGFGTELGRSLALKAAHGVLGDGGTAALVRSLRMGSQPLRGVDEALRGDFDHALATLLHYADKSAMAWSVESRMPFMDVRLVEFLATVPAVYKLHGGWTKWLARAAMAPVLPPSVCWRRDKLGWPIPEAQWFSGPLADWLAGQLAASPWAADQAARAGARPGLAARLRQLNLAVWHRLFFEEAGRPGRPLGRGVLASMTPT